MSLLWPFSILIILPDTENWLQIKKIDRELHGDSRGHGHSTPLYVCDKVIGWNMRVWSFDDLSIWILCYKKIDLRRTVCRRRRQIGQKWPFVHWASNWRWRKQIWKNLTTISAPQATLPDARHLQELHLSFLSSAAKFSSVTSAAKWVAFPNCCCDLIHLMIN